VWRGLHYAILSLEARKPNGFAYTNTDADWRWLQEKAADAARWLGYLPFEAIHDQRNPNWTVRRFKEPTPRATLSVGFEVTIPDADDMIPEIQVDGFVGVQPYKLVLWGEKSSLDPALRPVAEQRKADLYLPTGEISDTLLHQMASIGAEDGRPMVVFCFSDCDPAGWQMPISIGRKLQAFRDLEFPELEFEVHPVALTPGHVREYGLPSTPLKATERRADAWTAAMGIEQTEIDALAALQPDLLDRLARQAIAPFYDTGLDRRVAEARNWWLQEAQARVDATLDQEHLDRVREDASGRLEELREQIDNLNEELAVDVDDFDLPDFEIPRPRSPVRVCRWSRRTGISPSSAAGSSNRRPTETANDPTTKCPGRRHNGPGAGHKELPLMSDPNLPPDPEPAEPTVHELLLARIDEHCRLLGLELDQVAEACEQLEPERARSCRNAITMASMMIDEIRLRAHARPLDAPGQ
jgi:hypothetical protein